MSNMQSKDFHIFENDILRYEAHFNSFNEQIFDDFDAQSQKIDLSQKIKDLINGQIVNYSENQAAFHSKYRSENFISIPQRLQTNDFQNIVVCGIGGSFEGPKLLIESLSKPSDKKINHVFITGSDPYEFEEKISLLDPKETIFIISSKSFTTDETLKTLKDAIKWSGDMERFIAITANKDEAAKYNIKNILEFDIEIGGRYSIWSDISMPAIFGNQSLFDPSDFLKGGHQADLDLENDRSYFKLIKHLSFSDIWMNNYNGKHSRAVLSYVWKLRSFSNYVQQLEMESLGKQPNKNSKYKHTGQIIFGGYGPTAQHSYFQLLHQGTQNICADIIASLEDSESLSYAQAITQAKLLSSGSDDLVNRQEKINGNIPVNLFLLKKIDSFSLGYLIATWEHRTFITAMMLQINPFDQFGVNAGKLHTKKFLQGHGT